MSTPGRVSDELLYGFAIATGAVTRCEHGCYLRRCDNSAERDAFAAVAQAITDRRLSGVSLTATIADLAVLLDATPVTCPECEKTTPGRTKGPI